MQNIIPIINGTIYLTNDPNAAFGSLSQNVKCLIISGEIEVNPNDNRVIVGSILLPPPEAKMAEIDGDAEQFFRIYSEYLLSDMPSDFISVLLGYLHNGGNVIILVQCDINEPWVVNLINHLMMYYGLSAGIIGTDVQFQYDVNFNDSNNNILYAAGMISSGEYLVNTKLDVYPDFIYNKLITDIAMEYGDIGMDLNTLKSFMKKNKDATPSAVFRKVST